VHVVGWSLGGIFAVLAAADARPADRLADRGRVAGRRLQVPLVAPLRPLLTSPTAAGDQIYQLMGGAPKPLVRGPSSSRRSRSW
jgi:polyhydroxyalkanoate synthase